MSRARAISRLIAAVGAVTLGAGYAVLVGSAAGHWYERIIGGIAGALERAGAAL